MTPSALCRLLPDCSSLRHWTLLLGGLLGSGCTALAGGHHEYDQLEPTRSNVPPMLGVMAGGAGAIHPVVYQEIAPAPLSSLALNLDLVFKQTDAHNAAIALARTRVEEALADEAGCRHLPTLRPGSSDSEADASNCGCGLLSGLAGNLGSARRLAAEAKTWQRKAELAQTRYETLLDAGNTYIDLLTARRGEAIGRELEKSQTALLQRNQDIAKTERGATLLVESSLADVSGRKAMIAKLHQQGDAAASKLAYLMNLAPEAPLNIEIVTLEPVDRVDVNQPLASLIGEAQANGPGIHELQGLLAVIQQGLSRAGTCVARLPRVAYELRKAEFKLRETELALEEARGKLALGVQEAYSAIFSGRDQIRDNAENIRHAAETYRLTDLRLRENVPGSSPSEVSQSIRGLELAHFNHLTAVAAYNKAQIRLQLLLAH